MATDEIDGEAHFSIFEITSEWMGSRLSSEQIEVRVSEMLHRFEPLDPSMRNWLMLDMPDLKYVNLVDIGPRNAAIIERNRMMEEDEPAPEGGYTIVIKGSAVPSEYGSPDSIMITLIIGSEWINSVEFHVGAPQYPDDFNVITYLLYRRAIEILMAIWPCPWAVASYFGDKRAATDQYNDHTFNLPWIAYLSPPLAAGLKPPAGIICEPTPGGGVILSAVDAVIDPANPDHTRRADLLEAILIDRVGLDARTGLPRPAEHPARIGPY
jgi:hypothetical protein